MTKFEFGDLHDKISMASCAVAIFKDGRSDIKYLKTNTVKFARMCKSEMHNLIGVYNNKIQYKHLMDDIGYCGIRLD